MVLHTVDNLHHPIPRSVRACVEGQHEFSFGQRSGSIVAGTVVVLVDLTPTSIIVIFSSQCLVGVPYLVPFKDTKWGR